MPLKLNWMSRPLLSARLEVRILSGVQVQKHLCSVCSMEEHSASPPIDPNVIYAVRVRELDDNTFTNMCNALRFATFMDAEGYVVESVTRCERPKGNGEACTSTR